MYHDWKMGRLTFGPSHPLISLGDFGYLGSRLFGDHFIAKGFPGPFTVTDGGKTVTLQADLPGFAPRQVQVEVTADAVNVLATSSPDRADCHLTTDLSCRVDPHRSAALLKDGVLTITLRKVESPAPEAVKVKVMA